MVQRGVFFWVALWLLSNDTVAFSTGHRLSTRWQNVETTRLFGLRTKAKEKIASFKEKLRNNKTESSGLESVSPLSTPTIIPVSPVEFETSSSQDEDLNEEAPDIPSPQIPTNKTEQELIIPPNDVAFVQLPPLDPSRQLTEAEQEFRDKIAYYQLYSQRDMALLKSKRLRIVLDGMAASPLEPAVYKAFEILYHDIYPLRVAGRLIFGRLKQVLQQCVQARSDELTALQNTTPVSLPILEAAQFAFFEWIEIASDPTRVDDADINNDREHDLVLPTQQFLQSTWIVEDLLEAYSEEELLDLFDPNTMGTIDFPRWVEGFQRICEGPEDANTRLEDMLSNVTHKVLLRAKEDYPRVLDTTRQSYSDRFDEMLRTVRGWKKLSPNGRGRRCRQRSRRGFESPC